MGSLAKKKSAAIPKQAVKALNENCIAMGSDIKDSVILKSL